MADDQIKKKDGTVIIGQVQGVQGDGPNRQVIYSGRTSTGSPVRLQAYLSDVSTVVMATPAAVTAVKDGTPATVVAALEPVIKQFAGLPADWVIEAMAQLATAYSAQGQGPKASALYDQIDTLYPGSKYHLQAVAGKALMSLQQGQPDAALAAIQPLIDQANKDLAPAQAEGGLYASAFMAYGQILEAMKKPEQALEAYLTVKTMFYQNAGLAEKASQMAQKIRDQNPGLGVP